MLTKLNLNAAFFALADVAHDTNYCIFFYPMGYFRLIDQSVISIILFSGSRITLS